MRITLNQNLSDIPLLQVSTLKNAQFQKDTSGYSTLDVVSSEWLLDFEYNFFTEELRSQVNNIYSTFPEKGAQGWIIMVKIMLN